MRNVNFGSSKLGIAGILLLTMVCAFALGVGALDLAAGGSGDPGFARQALPYLHL